MTPHEKRLTAVLLRAASEQFSNHVCNDFNLTDVIADADERNALAAEAGIDTFATGDEPDYRMVDWLLMDIMADKLDEEAALEQTQAA